MERRMVRTRIGRVVARVVPALAVLALGAAPAGAADAADAGGAPAWPVPPNALAANGDIFDMASIGDRVYVTGDFTQIGRFAGSGVAVDPQTGTVNQSFPAVNGQISFVLTAPDGGWYIGGDFTEVGGTARQGLAHIEPNGTLDPLFDPAVNGLVDALALNGSSLYVGGAFTVVDGVSREGLAAVDAGTGRLLPFDARETGTATELYFRPAGATGPAILYAGMGQVLALDPVTGDPVAGFNSTIEAQIDALAADGNHLYVGGDGGMVALDATTGTVDPQFAVTPISLSGVPDFNGAVYSIVVQANRLLVGGDFNSLGGSQGPLVALNFDTGAADRNFRPQVVGSIYDMDQSGNTLWVGGSISSAGGLAAGNLVALDATTGARNPAVAPVFNGQVNGVRVGQGSVFVGGQFFLVNPLVDHGLAVVQGSTGALDTSFIASSPQSGLLSSAGTHLLSSETQFQGYDPTSRKHPYYGSSGTVQLLNPATGLRIPDSDLSGLRNLSGVAASPTQLFVDQRIGNKQRFPPNQVTVFDLRTHKQLYRYMLPLPGYVGQMQWVGGRLYVAGSFKRTRPNGQPANLAIIDVDPATGALDSDFDPHANGPVYALAAHGSDLLFAGLFGQVQGASRRGLAAVALGTGALDGGFRSIIPGNNLTALTPLHTDVFLQSPFHVNFLSYTGAVDPFVPNVKANAVTAVAATPAGALAGAVVATPLQGFSRTTLNFIRTVNG